MVAWERRKAVERTMYALSGKAAKEKSEESAVAKPIAAVGLSKRWKLGTFWNEVTSSSG